MQNFSIKIKLIIIFILIKIIPLLILLFIAYESVLRLDEYFKNSTNYLFQESKKVILQTANSSVDDSIRNLDKKSQLSIERTSYEIANNIAEFLYERDKDILFLSKLDLNKKILENFYSVKKKKILTHEKYYYNDKTNSWLTNEKINKDLRKSDISVLKDNKKDFHYTDPNILNKTTIPLYKELVFFDLEGNEKYKVSQINGKLTNVFVKKNTYINSEDYKNEIKSLKEEEIYVSSVIGEYVPSKIIGTFTKEKAKKAKIPFEPKSQAYAGKENPNGKKFEGIIRFITPVFKEKKKIGYISMALDHEHIMQFTDTSHPTSVDVKQNIADASVGNYAFMWDNKGRNISHPRDYFIVGYDKNTGNVVQPWLSEDVYKKYVDSKKDINTFLNDYPVFEEQSLSKKPNFNQLKEDGNIGLDCRYLNFAPQCKGWMQITENGGYGSFLIYWSNVWKLTTAATIPYYTGQYSSSKRGFGFVTIGANVDEFHAAANETKKNISKILDKQTINMKNIVYENEDEIKNYISRLIKNLGLTTFFMIIVIIIIALWLSSYISKKIESLLLGTKMFADNKLDYRINITSKDEIGKLEESFNNMATKIQKLVQEEKLLNETLEEKVSDEIEKRRKQEQLLIQQSKLASMGEMIGNIAHQWRQPLNSLGLVIQNIQIAHEMGHLNDEFVDKSVKKAKLLTSTMSRTIDDFRSYFVPNKIKEDFSIIVSIDKALLLVESSFKHSNINLIKVINSTPLFVSGYKNEFIQALLNILNNAKDALIETSIENKEIKIYFYKENNNAVIKIEDNGLGIDKNIIDKVFDPYFTTKEEGKGTGIGLYMTKTIIENNMSGKLLVINNKGATFIIKLPISENST